MSFAELLAFERLPADVGSAALRVRVSDAHVNMHGSAHGGLLYSLADEAFAIASNSREADAVALSVRMDYFLPVYPGDVLIATASEEHVGRRVATYRVTVARHAAADRDGAGGHERDARGEVVALFTGTVYRRPRPSGAG